jgi:hypothetical protein
MPQRTIRRTVSRRISRETRIIDLFKIGGVKAFDQGRKLVEKGKIVELGAHVPKNRTALKQ